jgi:hypothetical protein
MAEKTLGTAIVVLFLLALWIAWDGSWLIFGLVLGDTMAGLLLGEWLWRRA